MCAREIKFRCWWDKRMHVVEEINFKRERVDLLGADTISIEECILMQYTGIKDMLDDEICEGDILTANGKDFAIVEWCEERASFVLKPIGEYYFNSDILGEALNESKTEFVIVGNIYENKELLEKGE